MFGLGDALGEGCAGIVLIVVLEDVPNIKAIKPQMQRMRGEGSGTDGKYTERAELARVVVTRRKGV